MAFAIEIDATMRQRAGVHKERMYRGVTLKTFVIPILAGALLLSACATKRYPIATPLGQAEIAAMNCRELELELIRSDQVRMQISNTAQMDWRSVAGFLGDYGIGNAMAKNDAEKAINKRVQSIHEAKAAKGCGAEKTSWLRSIEAWAESLSAE